MSHNNPFKDIDDDDETVKPSVNLKDNILGSISTMKNIGNVLELFIGNMANTILKLIKMTDKPDDKSTD